MKYTTWPSDMPPDCCTEIQLRLFPMTEYEILLARVNELEIELKAKLERQRKGQFGKIGRNDKRMNDFEERLNIIERGICQMNQEDKSECEILELVGL